MSYQPSQGVAGPSLPSNVVDEILAGLPPGSFITNVNNVPVNQRGQARGQANVPPPPPAPVAKKATPPKNQQPRPANQVPRVAPQQARPQPMAQNFASQPAQVYQSVSTFNGKPANPTVTWTRQPRSQPQVARLAPSPQPSQQWVAEFGNALVGSKQPPRTQFVKMPAPQGQQKFVNVPAPQHVQQQKNAQAARAGPRMQQNVAVPRTEPEPQLQRKKQVRFRQDYSEEKRQTVGGSLPSRDTTPDSPRPTPQQKSPDPNLEYVRKRQLSLENNRALIQQREEEIKRREQEAIRREQTARQMEEKIARQRDEMARYNAEMERKRREHEQELARREREHQQELARREQQKEQELARREQEREQELNRREQEREQELARREAQARQLEESAKRLAQIQEKAKLRGSQPPPLPPRPVALPSRPPPRAARPGARQSDANYDFEAPRMPYPPGAEPPFSDNDNEHETSEEEEIRSPVRRRPFPRRELKADDPPDTPFSDKEPEVTRGGPGPRGPDPRSSQSSNEDLRRSRSMTPQQQPPMPQRPPQRDEDLTEEEKETRERNIRAYQREQDIAAGKYDPDAPIPKTAFPTVIRHQYGPPRPNNVPDYTTPETDEPQFMTYAEAQAKLFEGEQTRLSGGPMPAPQSEPQRPMEQPRSQQPKSRWKGFKMWRRSTKSSTRSSNGSNGPPMQNPFDTRLPPVAPTNVVPSGMDSKNGWRRREKGIDSAAGWRR